MNSKLSVESGRGAFEAEAERTERKVTAYEIMHGNQCVAEIDTAGLAGVNNPSFCPYDLYLEAETDIDTRMNNLMNFYHWCASRVLTLDRQYAKEILNSIGVAQAVTDQDRAKISLSYHCVSLTDIYWVKKKTETLRFEDINLYDNPLNEAIVELSLRGKQMTVTNQELAPDLSTKGCFPKAWIRCGDHFILLKDGGDDAVKRELLASKLCQHFDFRQVVYQEGSYAGEAVTRSRIITSKEYSIVSKMAFDIYAGNHDLHTIEECKRIDSVTFYGMNILDYLVGNTDRHPENWGFLVDNKTNQCISLYPIMDLNQSFKNYDTIDGANCQTLFPEIKSQREAAIEAVRQVKLRQKKEIDPQIFDIAPEWKEMFFQRLAILKKADSA